MITKMYKVKKQNSKWAWSSADNKFVMNADDAAIYNELGLFIVKGDSGVFKGEPTIKTFEKNNIASGGGMIIGVSGSFAEKVMLLKEQRKISKQLETASVADLID